MLGAIAGDIIGSVYEGAGPLRYGFELFKASCSLRRSFVPLVHTPALLLPLTAGVRERQISGNTIRELIEQLDKLYPGISERLLDGNHLRSGLSVFVDGLVRRAGLDFEVSAGSEVHFIPAVAGGVRPLLRE